VRDVLPTLLEVRARGGRAALATVVHTWHSAPRPAGAAMVVTDAGDVAGSVSGGCVEGALFELGLEVIADGRPRSETFGISDDDAFAVGLTCGGVLDVFVERVDDDSWPELDVVADGIARDEPVAVATVVSGARLLGRHLVVQEGGSHGSLGDHRLDTAVQAAARELLAAGASGTVHLDSTEPQDADGVDVFVTTLVPEPRMFVFGATDVAGALVRVGRLLGFRVTVVDARAVFATTKRFPEADDVVVEWPHRWLEQQRVDDRTVIAVLTHDPKFDVPALAVALRSRAAYVGALGSRTTHADRLARLREAGLTEDELQRLHAPIGLDLGARTPEETAVSIAAEIIQSRRGGSGRPLAGGDGPIHPATRP
jgi:xanthine dehydrogenase accessory factor